MYSQKTETVRGRLVDDMKNDRDKSRFVAAKLARDVKHFVRAGTSVLKALRMTINLATMRDGKHRLRNSVFYDITATFAHSPRRLAGEEGASFGAEGTVRYMDGFEAVAATPHENARNA